METKVACVLLVVCALTLSALADGQAETCTMAPKLRVNCGFPGVTAQECEAKGCCFDSSVPGYPWCFKPNTVDQGDNGDQGDNEDQGDDECPF